MSAQAYDRITKPYPPAPTSDTQVCPACAGAGAIQHASRNPELTRDCPTCDGARVVAA